MKKLLQIIRNVRFPVQVKIVNPLPYDFFKMYYKIIQSKSAIALEGLDELRSPIWAVVSQLYFKLALPQGISSTTDSFCLDTEFLKSLGIWDPELTDISGQPEWKDNIIGIRFYFGLTNDNALTLIMSTVFREDVIFNEENVAMKASNFRFYIPQNPKNGVWNSITKENAKIYIDNFKNSDVRLGKSKTERIRAYFLGESNLTKIINNRKGMKIYLGLFPKNVPINYEDSNEMKDFNLQLNIIGVDDYNLEPLGSFDRIFSSIETDGLFYINGIVYTYLHSGTAACVRPCPSFCGDE